MNDSLLNVSLYRSFEFVHEKEYKLAVVNILDQGQPLHPHSQMKIYTVNMLLMDTCQKTLSTFVGSDETEQNYRLI